MLPYSEVQAGVLFMHIACAQNKIVYKDWIVCAAEQLSSPQEKMRSSEAIQQSYAQFQKYLIENFC